MDDLRPEWRGLMVFVLKLFVRPFSSGEMAHPTIDIDDPGVRGRFLKAWPEIEPLLRKGKVDAIALMDVMYDEKTKKSALPDLTALYRAAQNVRSKKPQMTLTEKDIADMVQSSEYFLEFLTTGIKGIEEIGSPQNQLELEQFIQLPGWFLAVNVISFWHAKLLFPMLLLVARYSEEPVATDALVQAIAVDKMVLSLPWVLDRIRDAEVNNDRAFMRRLAKAISTPSIPKKAKEIALSYFLCMFNPWLSELSIGAQAELIREGGILITEKALRNRRSRLGLPKVVQKPNFALSPEVVAFVEKLGENRKEFR